jgi:hypothetical protein
MSAEVSEVAKASAEKIRERMNIAAGKQLLNFREATAFKLGYLEGAEDMIDILVSARKELNK